MARVTIRGGRKLARFIERASDPRLTDAALAAATARVLRRSVLPQLKAVMPFRTGKLRRSLRIITRGGTIELRGAFYWHFQKAGNTDKSLAEYAIDLINAQRPQLREEIKLELRRALGI